MEGKELSGCLVLPNAMRACLLVLGKSVDDHETLE